MKCPKCKTELPETANFCLKCGQGLNLGEQPPRPGPIPKAERKRVTALFSDLTGYTAMTERLDPEEVKEITSRIFDGTRAIIKKYEGFIERFAGDGVLALFGVPRAHEDDPTRAIRAAREIHKFVETLSPRYETKVGRALSMHSGINTGLAVTADVNPEKGTHGVTGEAINVAARLSDLAEARDILVGPDTYKASKSQFTFQPLKPAKVKGKSERIPIYKVLSEKTATARVSQEMQVSSEMVGRDQELAKLELHVLKAVNGQGSVVNVFGEPGVGKSRLLAELRKREVIKRASFLEGRCISIGKNLSFHPLIDLFKQWVKIKEDDTQAEASNKLETAIRRICGDETDEVFPFVATMMGMKLSGKHSERVEGIEGEALEKLILRNVRELLIRSSELIPIVILMEDLHWADTTSLELLESLFRLAQTSRVVFINIFRPGYWQGDDRKVETLPKWLSEVDFAEIAIKPLDRQAGETLVNNILQVKGLRHAVKKQIVDRSGGNPFFMEEIVRSLIDEGAIVRTNGAFEVTDKMDHVVIPSTINDVLTARIDRLEEQTRDLIKIASVIGRSFFDRILKEVADSIEQVDERLAYLKDAQFIRDRMRMEELEYLFKHALAQEAAYESTLIQQRKELHLKVAQSIEKIFQERVHEFYGMLAFHYSKADDLEKAEEYMTKAGEEALRSSAASEALNYLQEALKLYTDRYGDQADPERLISFKKNLALAHFNRGEFWEALPLYDENLASRGYRPTQGKLVSTCRLILNLIDIMTFLYSPINLKPRVPDQRELEVIDLRYRKALCLWVVDSKKSFFESMSLIRKSLRLDMPKTPRNREFISASSIPFVGLGFVSLSERLLKRAEDDAGGQIGSWAVALAASRILLSYRSGSWDSAPQFDPNLVDLAHKTGETIYPILYLYALGNLKAEQGLWNHLDLYARKAKSIADSYVHESARAAYHHIRTITLIRKRDFHQALTEAELGALLTDKAAFRPHYLRFIGNKAIAQALLGEIEQAKLSVREGELVLAKQKMIVIWYIIPFLVGRLITHIELLKQAIECDNQSDIRQIQRTAHRSAKQAVRKSREFAPYRTWILKLMGNYYWLIGKQRKALKWWDKSIQEGERLGARPDLSRTYFEVGKRLLEPQSKYKDLNGIEAKGYLEKARVLFEEMGLERDLDDLEKLKANYEL